MSPNNAFKGALKGFTGSPFAVPVFGQPIAPQEPAKKTGLPETGRRTGINKPQKTLSL